MTGGTALQSRRLSLVACCLWLAALRSGQLWLATLYRALHGHDALDQRLYARVTQAATAGGTVTHDNDRSHLYGYDGLRRLKSADMGSLNSTNAAMLAGGGGNPPAPTPREVDWTFDHLGNWAGYAPTSTPGRAIAGALNGEPTSTRHDTDDFNRIASLVQSGGSSGSSTTAYVYDRAGNLVCDGEFFYQYDAWNRLIAISAKGTLTFNADGVPTSGAPGAWQAHYTYDALGRLARRQAPWPQAGIGGNQDKRFEHYYYDGVRRIAEVFTDPLPAGDGEGEASSEEEEEEPPGPSTYTWTEREYVWGPPGGYVDELVCQLGGGETPSTQNAVRYAVLDANFNVAALVGGQSITSGGTLSSVPGGFGAVLEQYTYDPYGSILLCDTLVSGGTSADPNLPRNRVGHQGLFADRFDVSTLAAQLTAGGRVLYHNRNRTYMSWLGRFAQSDPHGTSQPVAAHAAGFGQIPSPRIVHDVTGLYMDGMNRFGYLGSAPVGRTDAAGLFWGFIGMGASQGLDFAMSVTGNLEELYAGYAQGLDAQSMMKQAALNQEIDADWALDWSASDYEYSAVGVHDYLNYGQSNVIAQGGGFNNPLYADVAAGRNLVYKKPLQTHHIATKYGHYGSQFKSIFDSAGMSIDDPANLVPNMRHSGRHSAEYHELVLERLKRSLEGCKTPADRAKALKKELGQLKGTVRSNASILYDTIGGKSTGWRGKRRSILFR